MIALNDPASIKTPERPKGSRLLCILHFCLALAFGVFVMVQEFIEAVVMTETVSRGVFRKNQIIDSIQICFVSVIALFTCANIATNRRNNTLCFDLAEVLILLIDVAFCLVNIV